MVAHRLCFGTSTFAAGRLRPGKPSEPGIKALRTAVACGVRLIHSNPKLGTQWAIRRALADADGADEVQHLIKVEAPLGASDRRLAANVDTAISMSMDILAVSQLQAVVLEIDLKRTERTDLLDHPDALAEFYAAGAWQACVGGAVAAALAYCHRPSHARAALTCDQISGVASQYSVTDSWASELLPEVAESGREFIGMSPLGRGTLVNHEAPTVDQRLAALHWAVADPRVRAVAVTVSTVRHLRELLSVVDNVSRVGHHAPIQSGHSRRASLGVPQ